MVRVRPVLHLLRLQGFPVLRQLQLEEALLRADLRNWCLLNDGAGDQPTIVLGISGFAPAVAVPEHPIPAKPFVNIEPPLF